VLVGIIGTGTVGTALADGLSAAGHDVVLGSRDPGAVDVGPRDGPGDVEVADRRTAAERGEAVVLAVPASAAVDVAGGLADALAGTALLDANDEYPTATAEDALVERIAAAAPDARVAKAFNTIGAEHMRDPVVGGDSATMFLAGDPEAVGKAERLAGALGFDTVAVGGLDRAGRLEDLARLWIDLAREHGRGIAFRLLRE